MNCGAKLLELTIFLNLYTKLPLNSGSENPLHKRDLSLILNLDIKPYNSIGGKM